MYSSAYNFAAMSGPLADPVMSGPLVDALSGPLADPAVYALGCPGYNIYDMTGDAHQVSHPQRPWHSGTEYQAPGGIEHLTLDDNIYIDPERKEFSLAQAESVLFDLPAPVDEAYMPGDPVSGDPVGMYINMDAVDELVVPKTDPTADIVSSPAASPTMAFSPYTAFSLDIQFQPAAGAQYGGDIIDLTRQEPAVGSQQEPAVGFQQEPAVGFQQEPAVGSWQEPASSVQPSADCELAIETARDAINGPAADTVGNPNAIGAAVGEPLAAEVKPYIGARFNAIHDYTTGRIHNIERIQGPDYGFTDSVYEHFVRAAPPGQPQAIYDGIALCKGITSNIGAVAEFMRYHATAVLGDNIIRLNRDPTARNTWAPHTSARVRVRMTFHQCRNINVRFQIQHPPANCHSYLVAMPLCPGPTGEMIKYVVCAMYELLRYMFNNAVKHLGVNKFIDIGSAKVTYNKRLTITMVCGLY